MKLAKNLSQLNKNADEKIPKKFNFDNHTVSNAPNDYEINSFYEGEDYEYCNYKTDPENSKVELVSNNFKDKVFNDKMIEALSQKLGDADVSQFQFVIQEDVEYMLILMIIDSKLALKILNNPSIGQLPKLDESNMHKFTKLAYKIKHGV